MRALGDSEGLPRLPDVRYYLWIRPHTVNPVVVQAFNLVKTGLGIDPGK